MLVAPFQWLVREDAHLPEPLRPGVLLALVLGLLWFGIVRRVRPTVLRTRRRGRVVRVSLRCPPGSDCFGRLQVRDGGGRSLFTDTYVIRAATARSVRVVLSREQMDGLHGVRVSVERR